MTLTPPAVVLTYHNVIPDELYDDAVHLGVSHRASTFERHVRLLARFFSGSDDPLSLRPGQCVFTFDDGYRNNLLAAEILEKHGFRGVFFLCAQSFETGELLFVDKVLKWLSYAPPGQYCLDPCSLTFTLSDRKSRTAAATAILARQRATFGNEVQIVRQLNSQFWLDDSRLPPELLDMRFTPLAHAEVGSLQARGHLIGCHSWAHHNLRLLADEALEEDFIHCTPFVSRVCNTSVFSYPFGGVKEVDCRVAKAARRHGFSSAVTNLPHWPTKPGNLSAFLVGRTSLPEELGVMRQIARILGLDPRHARPFRQSR